MSTPNCNIPSTVCPLNKLDVKTFEQFRIDVLNRLEEIRDSMGKVVNQQDKQKALLFGLNGEPGKLASIEQRLEKHGKAIDWLKNLIWPMIGAAALLGWMGIQGIRELLGK